MQFTALKHTQRPGRAVLFALAVMLSLFASPHAASANSATNFVTSVGNSVLAIVGNKSLSTAQKAARFSSILGRKADMRRIGLFALGPFARKIKGAQRAEYLRLVKRFVINVYFKRLVDFGKAGGKVKIINSISRPKDFIVSSKIAFNDGRTVPVKWRLTRSGGVRLFDLNISGVWLTLEQRTVFVSIIRRNNNDIGALIKHLRKSVGR